MSPLVLRTLPLRVGLVCTACASLMAALLPARSAAAQERPDEQTLFGGSPTPSATTTNGANSGPAGVHAQSNAAANTSTPATPNPQQVGAVDRDRPGPTSATNPSAANSDAARRRDTQRDSQIMGAGDAPPMFLEQPAPADPLTVGGQVYFRLQSTASEGQHIDQFSFGAPSMLDVYLDARPNDRVRAFARGRMVYDPTLPTSATSANSISAAAASGGTSGTQALSSLFQSQTREPKVVLDQLWLNFDIARRLFVTAGKQHVRWGTARFWAPTDFLHLRPRNPLDVFDARTGTTMVKVHLPIESRQWNFYAYGLTEGPNASSTLGSLGAAARAEFVLGTTELGLGVLGRRQSKPRFAADLSTGIGDFDFYSEVAVRSQSEIDRVKYESEPLIASPPVPQSWQPPMEVERNRLEQLVDAYYPVFRRQGYRPQVVGGLNYSRKYNDNDVFTIGAEYFYNSFGYSSPSSYPGLVLPHSRALSEPANFFYLGQHYGAVYLTLPAPYSLDNHSFTLSTLGNLTDYSFITRFDYSLVVLTHIRFEAFVSGRYGNPNGEFRFGVTNLSIGGMTFSRPPAFGDVGVALRAAI